MRTFLVLAVLAFASVFVAPARADGPILQPTLCDSVPDPLAPTDGTLSCHSPPPCDTCMCVQLRGAAFEAEASGLGQSADAFVSADNPCRIEASASYDTGEPDPYDPVVVTLTHEG
jgi:hypothetical protein